MLEAYILVYQFSHIVCMRTQSNRDAKFSNPPTHRSVFAKLGLPVKKLNSLCKLLSVTATTYSFALEGYISLLHERRVCLCGGGFKNFAFLFD